MDDELDLNQDLRVRVTEEERMEIEKLVDARSEPGKRVTISDILREAIGEYLERHDEAREAHAK